MDSNQIRTRFLEFFESKGHKIVPSSSLVPENDPSVLFTTAGMQQFKPYYLGKRDSQADFGSLSTCSVQKCVRTSDIDEVGDERHLTFFEMLGNFSFGGYWKEEAIQYAHEFVTKEMGLIIDYVTVFEGEEGVPADTESEKIWQSIDPNIVVKKFGRADNFWGPTGEEGPCGPTTEVYVDGIEIWNIVFNEFFQYKDKTLEPLPTKGIDTGMGLERLVKVVQRVPTVFETDLLYGVVREIEDQTRPMGKGVDEGVTEEEQQNHEQMLETEQAVKAKRVIADHLRSAMFMIADGIVPSNNERGYVLRRLIRRAVLNAKKINLDTQEFGEVISVSLMPTYKNSYPELEVKKPYIHETIQTEVKKFEETLEKGLRQFEKGEDPFVLFTTYGFPFELTQELAQEKGIKLDKEKFDEQMRQHQEVSKAGMEQKFKGGLGGHSEMEVKYHTATHLLHQALREVLGTHVQQKGSNITPERLRFDFAHPQKMTDEEKRRVEEMVNEKIKEDLEVHKVIMSKADAEKSGALHFFGEKYPNEVSVYYIGDSLESAYSKEFCGGPHVERTGQLGRFKIAKEEAVAAGIRRIKATLS